MRFDIKKLTKAGLYVRVDNDAIEISGATIPEENWNAVREQIKLLGVYEPALQDYVMGAWVIALQRAQILELAE